MDNVLHQSFEKAIEIAGNLKKRPTNEELLNLYANFKQAKFGDNNTSRPGILDIKGKAKWDAWNNIKGTTCQDAMQNYINLSMDLFKKYGK